MQNDLEALGSSGGGFGGEGEGGSGRREAGQGAEIRLESFRALSTLLRSYDVAEAKGASQ